MSLRFDSNGASAMFPSHRNGQSKRENQKALTVPALILRFFYFIFLSLTSHKNCFAFFFLLLNTKHIPCCLFVALFSSFHASPRFFAGGATKNFLFLFGHENSIGIFYCSPNRGHMHRMNEWSDRKTTDSTFTRLLLEH